MNSELPDKQAVNVLWNSYDISATALIALIAMQLKQIAENPTV
jgi:hypothetical protein